MYEVRREAQSGAAEKARGPLRDGAVTGHETVRQERCVDDENAHGESQSRSCSASVLLARLERWNALERPESTSRVRSLGLL